MPRRPMAVWSELLMVEERIDGCARVTPSRRDINRQIIDDAQNKGASRHEWVRPPLNLRHEDEAFFGITPQRVREMKEEESRIAYGRVYVESGMYREKYQTEPIYSSRIEPDESTR
jgi:hypothetical protein